MTGTQPYAEYTDKEVEALFKKGIFPEVDSIPCGELIRKCWHSQVHLAEEVRMSIAAELQKFE